jgi:hypothetical protein
MPVKWNMNMKTLKVIAVVLLVVIVLGAGIYWMVSGMSNRGLEGFQTATTTTTQPTTIPEPPNPSTILGNFRANNTDWKVGEKHTFIVTGTATNNTSNRIWGGGDALGTYTLDSPIAVAAVHAGIVPLGITGIVTIIIIAGQNSYTASTRNGIASLSFGKYEASYRFEQDSRNIRGLKEGTHSFKIRGTTGWGIWGGGDVLATYTADSPIVTAAVHAGIIKKNKDKEITILILPGIDTYIGVTRNDITSSNFGKYDKAYRFIDPALPLLNQDLGKIQSELEQKKNNLATAQSELSAASAALNNAIKSASVEGFQTVGTTTTTTTAQVVSPIMAKINQLKELQKQKAIEFAKTKSELEADKGKVQAMIDSTNARLAEAGYGDMSKPISARLDNLANKKTVLESDKDRLTKAISELGIQDNANVVANVQSIASKLASTSTSLNSILAESFQNMQNATPANPNIISLIEKLPNQISQLKAMRNDARSGLSTANATLSGVQNKLSIQGYKMDNLDTILSNAGRVAGLESELNIAKEAKKTAEDALTTAAQNLADAKDAGIKDKVSIASLESELANAKTEVTTKQNQIDNINKALAEATANTDTLVRNARIDERLAAEQKYNMLTDSYNILNNELQNAKTEIIRLDSIKNTSALTDPERAKFNKDLLDKQAEISSITTKLMDVESKLKDCSTKLNAAPVAQMLPPPVGATAVPVPPPVGATVVQTPTLGTPNVPMPPPTLVGYPAVQTPTLPNVLLPDSTTNPTVQGPIQPAELRHIPPQQEQTATYGIADTSLSAATGFTDIPKHKLQQLIQNARSNPYWTYRPENYDSHNRYAAPTSWWVTGYNF